MFFVSMMGTMPFYRRLLLVFIEKRMTVALQVEWSDHNH